MFGCTVASKINKKNAKNDEILSLLHSLLYNKRGKVSFETCLMPVTAPQQPLPARMIKLPSRKGECIAGRGQRGRAKQSTIFVLMPVSVLQATALKKNILEFSGFLWANEVYLTPLAKPSYITIPYCLVRL